MNGGEHTRGHSHGYVEKHHLLTSGFHGLPDSGPWHPRNHVMFQGVYFFETSLPGPFFTSRLRLLFVDGLAHRQPEA